MSPRSNRAKKPKRFETYGSGTGVYVTDEMRQSAAYKSLTPSQRLVLLDFIRAYLKASGYDEVDISAIGFNFPWSYCLEDMDEKTFREARRVLCARNFFVKAIHLKRPVPGSPDVFLPSTEWRDYEPDTHVQEKLRKPKFRKEAAILRAKERKRDFCVRELKPSSAKRGGRNSRDTTG